jgi:hypothetical protein
MNASELVELRRDELRDFFAGRFGLNWRQIVALQADVHPRSFQLWYHLPSTRLFKLVTQVEAYARKIGFTSASDQPLAAALKRRKKLRAAAKAEVAKLRSEREEAVFCVEDFARRWNELKLEESRRREERGGGSVSPASPGPGHEAQSLLLPAL